MTFFLHVPPRFCNNYEYESRHQVGKLYFILLPTLHSKNVTKWLHEKLTCRPYAINATALLLAASSHRLELSSEGIWKNQRVLTSTSNIFKMKQGTEICVIFKS